MPLSEEEKQEILQTLGGSQRPSAPQTPSLPGALPPEISSMVSGLPQPQPYLSSVSSGGRRISFPNPNENPERKLILDAASQRLKAKYPVPTESERERGRLERSAVKFLESFEKKLGVDYANRTVKNEKLLTPTRTFVPQKYQEYVMKEEEMNAYNDLDSAFSVGVIALTGRQGDVDKLRQLQQIYSFGGGLRGKPDAVINRLENLKRLFSTIQDTKSSNEEIDAQIDSLIMENSDPLGIR